MSNVKEVVRDNNPLTRNEKYNNYIDDITPKHNIWINILWSFVCGGSICAIGQGISNFYVYLGASKDDASLYLILTLVFISVVLTGFGVYARFAKFAGAGAIVPITGFANSVASSAIEYKKEGQVFGIGCKIFVIAGPVILYGIFSTWVLGVIYWLMNI